MLARVGGTGAAFFASVALSLWISGCGTDKGGEAAEAGECSTDCPSGDDDDDDATDDDDDTDPDGPGDDDDDDDNDDDDDDDSAADGIPCAVQDVLAANCWSCHGDAPQFGAPASLTSYEDFQVPAPSDAARPMHELVGERVTSENNPMPADGSLSGGDRAVLVDWVDAGAPASDEQCDPDPDPDPDPEVGPDELPCEVTHTFTAHANGSDTDPFHVPLVDNLYECFTFASPLTSETQITAWAPIVDDERVLHHWILYKTSEQQPDGGVGPCNMPGDASFVAGWAPGGTNFIMPDEVGLEFGGPDDYYILQLHYNNTGRYDDALDNSGVAFCTSEPRPNTAGIIWLGTTGISIPSDAVGHEESGVCPSSATGLLPFDLNIIASFPHMHELGRQLETTVYRGGAGGPAETLVNADPFSFDNQIMYPHEPYFVLEPGDELVTTCTYDNTYGTPVGFGEDTEDEMCFNFIMAYPIQLLPSEARQCVF